MMVTPIALTSPEGRRFSLTLGREYEVLGIEADLYRILSDRKSRPYGNDPVLFDPACFKMVDPRESEFWECEAGADGAVLEMCEGLLPPYLERD